MERKYITVEEEEEYFKRIYDETIGDIENSIFLTPNYIGSDYELERIKDPQNVKSDMEKIFCIEEEKIKRLASVDIASGGILPMPYKGESVNVRIVGSPRKQVNLYISRCVIFGREDDLQYELMISSVLAKGIFSELLKTKIEIDDSLKCIVGRVFTIAGRDWPTAPKELWKIDDITKKPVSPKVYMVALRFDLEVMGNKIRLEEEGPDLVTF